MMQDILREDNDGKGSEAHRLTYIYLTLEVSKPCGIALCEIRSKWCGWYAMEKGI